jgi:hypothetical protein
LGNILIVWKSIFPKASEFMSRKGSSLDMPFPPGVGVRSTGEAPPETESYEVITADRAIDENNVGNRILRNMGWQEGLVCVSISLCPFVSFSGAVLMLLFAIVY